MFPRTNEAGTGAVALPLSELDRDVLTGPPWLWLWLPWRAGGGGIRDSLLWALRDFSSSSSFCISSGDIWRAPLASPGQGSAGTRERLGTDGASPSSSTVSRGDRLVLILSGYKNSSWVPVLRRAYRKVKQSFDSQELPWFKPRVRSSSSNVWVCWWNPNVCPFKWKLFSSPFLWCCSLCCTKWF